MVLASNSATTLNASPAKAGVHLSPAGAADRWVPAFPTDQVRGLKAHGKAVWAWFHPLRVGGAGGGLTRNNAVRDGATTLNPSPAKAGVHPSTAGAADRWVPASAGKAVWAWFHNVGAGEAVGGWKGITHRAAARPDCKAHGRTAGHS